MEWLRKLIEAATIKDGKLDADALMTSINAEFPKNAVPKDTFNDISGQLKTANTTIKTLKDDNTGSETLQKTIKDHETTIANLRDEATKKEKEVIVKAAYKDAGVTDPDYIIFKNGGIDKYELDKEGKIKDLDNFIKQDKENNPTFFKVVDPNKKEEPKVIENKLPGDNTPPAGDDVASQFANAIKGVS